MVLYKTVCLQQKDAKIFLNNLLLCEQRKQRKRTVVLPFNQKVENLQQPECAAALQTNKHSDDGGALRVWWCLVLAHWR